jgi:hypothetical protein
MFFPSCDSADVTMSWHMQVGAGGEAACNTVGILFATFKTSDRSQFSEAGSRGTTVAATASRRPDT